MGKYMNQLKQLQRDKNTLTYLHNRSLNIAGVEEKGFMYETTKQHHQMTEDYYSRQIAEVLPHAIQEAVEEYISGMNVSVSMDGEQIGKIAEVAANKIANGIIGNFGKGR